MFYPICLSPKQKHDIVCWILFPLSLPPLRMPSLLLCTFRDQIYYFISLLHCIGSEFLWRLFIFPLSYRNLSLFTPLPHIYTHLILFFICLLVMYPSWNEYFPGIRIFCLFWTCFTYIERYWSSSSCSFSNPFDCDLIRITKKWFFWGYLVDRLYH